MLSYTLSISSHLYFSSTPLPKKIQGFVFCVMYSLIIGSSWNWNVLDKAQIQMINTCLDFEVKILQGEEKLKTSVQTKGMFVFFHILKHNYYLIPLAVLGLILIDPCTPPFLLSMSTNCSAIRWNGWVILIPLIETYICACFFYIGIVAIVYNLFAGISSLMSYFQLLERKILTATSLTGCESCISKYRMIQLVEKIMNAFSMEQVVPSIVCGIPLLQIVLQYVIITMHGEIAMPVFLMFPATLFNAVVNNMLIFTLASWVYNSSVKVLRKLDMTILQYTRKSVIRKQWKSCGRLKIKFGSNFIDGGTPLVIQNFCLNQTMSLILIKEG
ncbi:hypothetical protein Fcan01_15930 [Folsomia candida]|uniref:Uncharacterized protein n=1 Tax=Folsomia candida TaxID=158441 RepID=A0A226DYU2_FOLCA|nr:hypothetical protein Fcan01_15930 [Folsomia candida]